MVTQRRGLIAALFGAAALFGGAAVGAEPLRIQDDLRRSITLAKPPLRIVSLLPSITETVCALGECARLVAVDRYSNWPASVNGLPKAGGLDDAQVELIVDLKPDLVLLASSARVTARLEQLGLTTFAVEAKSYADVARAVTLLARVLGVPVRAAALNAKIEQGVAAVAQQAALRRPVGTPAPSVYFEVSRSPHAAGPGSFIGEMLSRLHTRNIVDAQLGPFPQLNPEYIVRGNPDVIFVSPKEAPSLAARPGWASIRAVREKRLCSFTPEQNDAIVRPGPRVVDGMQALADCLVKVAP